MPGFTVMRQNTWEQGFGLPDDRFLNEIIHANEYTAFRSTLRKFEQDKIFADNGTYCMILEGVLLNKQALFERYSVSDMKALIERMYEEDDTFFSQLRGSFCGALYDRKKDLWLIFTNQTGEKAVYYRQDATAFAASTNLHLLYDISRANGRTLTVDENAVYMGLTFFHMEDASTYAQEIRRLRGGTYLRITAEDCKVCTYHMFHKDPERFRNQSEDAVIEEVEKSFSAAVRSQFDKDLEYGYRHLCDLSGGLDSRMNMWTAHDLGYRDFTLLNYGKAGYLDEQIAKQISLYWKDHLIITPTDNLLFIRDVDKVTEMNGASSGYASITGAVRMLESLNLQPFGLEHTGLIGEVVLGAHIADLAAYRDKTVSVMGSERLKDRLKDNTPFRDSFEDYEIYLRYVAEFQGDANSVQCRNYYTEVCSPFLDVEFLQLCFDIPLSARLDHALYKKWILKKHPQAAKFRWERINGRIDESKLILQCRKALYKGPHKAARILGLEQYPILNMNPMDYWLASDSETAEFLNGYYHQSCRFIGKRLSEKLRKDITSLYRKGNAYEKLAVITVLGGMNRLFGKERTDLYKL